jgi:acetyl-CoA carboxylase biotin carboxyl carrier protein
MEYNQIQELIKAINESSISKLRIKDGDFELTIEQQSDQAMMAYAPQQMPQQMQYMQAPQQMPQQASPAAPAAGGEAPAATGNTIIIKSPMIGTFYRSPSPDKPAFVNVGDEVRPGMPLCIIEAMKLFNEIECEVTGRIVKMLIDDASPVEYDQPLFLVEPA